MHVICAICAIYAEESIGGENAMAMLKVIEVLAESTKNREDAAQQAIADASKTVRNVKSIYVENFEATADNGQTKAYSINARISFAPRQFLRGYIFRTQQNTRYIESDMREATVSHVLDALISRLTVAASQHETGLSEAA
jgi:flavin-binding protein dodecin